MTDIELRNKVFKAKKTTIAFCENCKLKEKYEKQKEINKELVDENEALKFAARMSENTEKQLQKENAELEKDKAYAEEQLDEQIQATLKLQKENAELKAELEENKDLPAIAYQQGAEWWKKKSDSKLAQAKELIKGLLDLPDLIEDRTSEHTELIGRAEQFLEEEA